MVKVEGVGTTVSKLVQNRQSNDLIFYYNLMQGVSWQVNGC